MLDLHPLIVQPRRFDMTPLAAAEYICRVTNPILDVQEEKKQRLPKIIIDGVDRIMAPSASVMAAFVLCRRVAFENDLVSIEFARTKMTLNKPIYAGTAILDLPKLLMYSFYYEVLQPRYGRSVRLLYTDTDSLIVYIETDYLYADMSDKITIYDTSNYSTSHHLYSIDNKKVVGKFKDELGGNPIKEFIGLRSKMYAYHCGDDDDDNGKRAKGVQRSVLKNTITVDDYRTCLVEESQPKRTMNVLRSREHHIHGEERHKTVDSRANPTFCRMVSPP